MPKTTKQINVHLSADTREKVEWLAEVLDENFSSLVKRLVLKEYEIQKASYQADRDFVRWIRSQRENS